MTNTITEVQIKEGGEVEDVMAISIDSAPREVGGTTHFDADADGASTYTYLGTRFYMLSPQRDSQVSPHGIGPSPIHHKGSETGSLRKITANGSTRKHRSD